jgi:hypothetical protein
MKVRRTATLMLMLLWVLFVATGIATIGAQHANAAPSAGGCPTHGQVACVDRTDGGHTVHVRVGHTLQVTLGGPALRWSGLHQVGPVLLRRSGPIVQHNGAIAATYRAVKAGHTTLRAGGAPTCNPGRACPQFVLLWQVRVVVG